MEIWKDIKGFEGLYQVSNLGRIKKMPKTIMTKKGEKTKKGFIMKLETGKNNYIMIKITRDKKRYHLYVSRIVAENFIDNPNGKREVNHINGDKSDNSISNLEWVTKQENMTHAKENGLIATGEKSGRAKFKYCQIKAIRKMYDSGNYSTRALAKMFNVSSATTWKIVARKTWKHI